MKPHDDQTDIAALAAGVVAVSVSMFVAPGPYDVSGFMVAVTLLLVLYGYVWNKSRSLPQSAALGAVVGIIALPIVGFLAELALSRFVGSDSFLAGLIAAAHAPIVEGAPPASRVSGWFLLSIWIVVGFCCAFIDCNKQPK